MKVFLSEFFVGGAAHLTATNASIRREGWAMLHAVAADIARLPGCSVITTLGIDQAHQINGDVIQIKEPAHEAQVFQKLLTEVDAVLVIAPEMDGILADRCQRVHSAGVMSWNCTPGTVQLCGDKLQLYKQLRLYDLPTVVTRQVDLDKLPDEPWPVVLKPIDGAGSYLTFLIQNRGQWEAAVRQIRAGAKARRFIIQPFCAGRTLSIGVNISFDKQRIECMAIGEQRLSDDGLFRYLGGVIPARIPRTAVDRIEDLVLRVCRTIPGLAGYIGIDLILTERGDPIIVEINPRLTTSYVGYRQLYSTSLPERWLSPPEIPLAKLKKTESVEFRSDKF